MGLFDGKKGLIIGVANKWSIAWAIAEQIMAEGGECGFTHLPDKPEDDKKKNHRRVAQCTEKSNLDNPNHIAAGMLGMVVMPPSSPAASRLWPPPHAGQWRFESRKGV